jgi:type IV pilus assembly protein PilW
MHRVHERGFGIVELMVAMGLSLLLFTGALTLYLSSKNSYVDNDRLSRLQESGRIALDVISRDLRNSGYHGCVRLEADRFLNRLVDGSNSVFWSFERPITGWNGDGASWTTGGDGVAFDGTLTPAADPANDVIVIRGPAREGGNLVTSANAAETEVVPIDPPAAASLAPAAGDLMMLTDCEWTAVFQVSAFGADQIEHASGGSTPEGLPGNVDDSLGAGFLAGAQALPLRSVAYYVAPSGSVLGGPALWRRVGGQPAEELLEGVERLQFLYGFDPNEDGIVDRYVGAADVTRWRDVVAVQIGILIRTPSEDGTAVDTATYDVLDDVGFDPADDRRQRALFVTTVTLRNRTL